MELSLVFGLAGGIGVIILGIITDGKLGSFFDFASVYITIGGTFMATFATYSFKQIIPMFKNIGLLFKRNNGANLEIIQEITDLATRARQEGLLSLEDAAHNIQNPFFKKGVMLIVDATDPELVKNIMETELFYIDERHQNGAKVFDSLSSYSPAFGMIGTIIGLINMLKKLDDPSAIGPSMSVALVTTFYGVVMANLIFTPIANRFRQLNDVEMLEKTIILEGILSIQAGENPRIIQEKLLSFFPNSVTLGGSEEDDYEESDVDGERPSPAAQQVMEEA